MVTQYFYVSEVVEPLSDIDVQVILGAALVRNRRLDVTGMLAQSDGHFAQVLEGRRNAVDQVVERLRRDPRHRSLRLLLDEKVPQRRFAHWSMVLIRRSDMAAELRQLHEQGVPTVEAAHAWITRLMRWLP